MAAGIEDCGEQAHIDPEKAGEATGYSIPPGNVRSDRLTAIPCNAWSNRVKGKMKVLLPAMAQ